jgi:hypothetical protein
MNVLERLDNITVLLDGAIDSKKELPEGMKPLGFHVGQGGGNVGEEGHTPVVLIAYWTHATAMQRSWTGCLEHRQCHRKVWI